MEAVTMEGVTIMRKNDQAEHVIAISKTRKNRISKKQRHDCFRSALGALIVEQREYIANRKMANPFYVAANRKNR